MEITRPGEVYQQKLSGIPGKNEGLLSRLSILGFGIIDIYCMSRDSIDGLALVADGNNGWNIDSIVTFLYRSPSLWSGEVVYTCPSAYPRYQCKPLGGWQMEMYLGSVLILPWSELLPVDELLIQTLLGLLVLWLHVYNNDV